MKVPLLILTAVALLHSASGSCVKERCKKVRCVLGGYSGYHSDQLFDCNCTETGTIIKNRCLPLPWRDSERPSCTADGRTYQCYCAEVMEQCSLIQPPTTLPPPTTVNPAFSGFPAGDFMIKHEHSGLCVQHLHPKVPALKPCDSSIRAQKWYTEGKNIMSRQPGYWSHLRGLILTEAGRGALSYAYTSPPGSAIPRRKWDYKNKHLISMAANNPNLIPQRGYERNGYTLARTAKVNSIIEGKPMADATEVDKVWMKWLLIPV